MKKKTIKSVGCADQMTRVLWMMTERSNGLEIKYFTELEETLV